MLYLCIMKLHFYKYQGTGNDFVILDNRNNTFPKENVTLVNFLCDRRFGVGGDGLMLLENSENYDFKMVYYNADGNEGSMCGNGGRCLVAFANQIGVIENETTFEAIDGLHHATIDNGIVSLHMIDVNNINIEDSHSFLDTGSPHHIEFSDNVSDINIQERGSSIRYGAPYFEEGTNVNFVETIDDKTIKIRTYERGVEGETLSCGTGATAAAIASLVNNKVSQNNIDVFVQGGKVNISFEENDGRFTNVYLTGPAQFVFDAIIEVDENFTRK